MATASAVPPGLVTSRPASQFGQFRGVTQIINTQHSTPNATSAHAYPTSSSTSTNSLEASQMAQASRPSSGQNIERNPSIVSSRAIPQVHTRPNSSPSVGQLELVELASNPLIEGVLGPNKDGRVRNPVPSKLKGKTDNKQGNFGVMHMGTSPGKKTEAQARDSAAERDAAARRTSENTASRAKAAQQEKYIPPKKRGIEAALNEPGSRGSPFAVSKNDDRNRARPLAPDETKFEQARLLTLLRSINPVTVVDQICKAIAYFGGIPGAPPPEDGIFPESANTRETGALFIGWIAEIFPDLSSRSPEVAKEAAGIAGKKKSRPGAGKKGNDAAEIELPNSRNGYGYGPAVSAPAWGLPPSLALVNTPIPAPVAAEGGHNAGPAYEQNKPMAAEPTLATAAKSQQEDTSADASSKRRRGRPKGSRNKGGKGEGPPGGDGAGSNNPEPGSNNQMPDGHPHQSPEMTVNSSSDTLPAGYGTGTNQANVQKSVQSYQYPAQSWSNQQRNSGGQATAPQGDELSPEERAVLEAFRNQGVETLSAAVSAPIAPIAPMTNPAAKPQGNEKKRKRPPTKLKANAAAASSSAATSSNHVLNHSQDPQSTSTQPPPNSVPVGKSQDSTQWTSVSTTTPILPPAKKPRVRKPKAPAAAEPPARNQTASVLSSSTPTITPSTIPDTQPMIPQQNQPISRPPAEGLEAHYERFANLQQANLQQQNGRSRTPTQPQHQRQQSKPSSVPPQQLTPQLQHQPMQRQKSQQASQTNHKKDDQKVTQNSSSSRPSSTPYYGNQRTQSTSYGQQYPPHQSTQLYTGHQASPQLSNSNALSNTNPMTNANSLSNSNAATGNYNRNYGSHSLAQASPQFSQSEASYRTASPHAIAQPSPSFSQNDNTFRTNSHSIPQPTTSYSQTENSYRAPTTHNTAQPTSSYNSARTHSQPQTSHQSHYNHFSDSSFIDLPTLESLGHTGSSNTSSNVGMAVGNYGQSLGVGSTARSTGTSNTIYGTSTGLANPYDTSTNDLLRGVSRSTSNTNPGGYVSASSGLGAFEASTTNEHEMRDRLMRGIGRR